MEEPYDYTQEDHMREVERAMMYIAQAQRKAEEIATGLARDGAEERLVDALRTASGALKAEHNRLLNRTHFPVPESRAERDRAPDGGDPAQASIDDESGPPAADQQRMAL